jgi:predicted GNAT family acetyltransferase
MSDISIVDDRQAGRYCLLLDGSEIGAAEYDAIGNESVLVKHVEVSSGHEGKGYAARLVRHVLDDLRARKLSVVPICPYALAFIRKHREYADIVRDDMRNTL